MYSGFNVLHRLHTISGSLKKAEGRVAAIVLEGPDQAVRFSIKELAGAADASEPTVLRLVRKLGCNGFSDFKLRLSQELAIAQMFVFSETDAPPRRAGDVIDKVYHSAELALDHCFTQRDPEALESAAKAILSASRLFCFGIGGSSANMAAEAETRFFRYDVNVTSTGDHYRQRMIAGLCEASDVLLIFSVTGQPPALVGSAQIAREMGATVISITRPQSSLAAASSIVLPLDIPDHEKHFQIPHRSRYGQLYILDCLATLVATERLERSAGKLRTLRRLLLDMNGPTEQQPIGD
jgi:RpiR family transcriptional regulator, carbohydrate utilization regulator